MAIKRTGVRLWRPVDMRFPGSRAGKRPRRARGMPGCGRGSGSGTVVPHCGRL